MATVGYARVSTDDQSLDRQQDELKAAGGEMIYSEVGSGKKGAVRPVWDELGRSLRAGDTLMVTELSRLGRSTSQLSALADDHDYLLEGDVFTTDLIETWIEWKTLNEVDPIRFRPHPHEFEMYYDI